MPKVPYTLYDHNAHPTMTQQFGLYTGVAGRSTISVHSRNITVAPEPSAPAPSFVNASPMDIDEDFQNSEAPDPGNIDDEEPGAGDEAIEEVLPGLRLKAIKKAKRYESSVGLPSISLLTFQFTNQLITGCSPSSLEGCSP